MTRRCLSAGVFVIRGIGAGICTCEWDEADEVSVPLICGLISLRLRVSLGDARMPCFGVKAITGPH
jgi:hypothetical protein